MGKSFQDQLLALGLVDKKKAAEAKKAKHKAKKKQAKTERPVIDENARLAREAEEKKKARADHLNRKRQAKLQRREQESRIKQLIEQHMLEKDEKGVGYRFVFKKKIHRVFVTQEMIKRLGEGKLAIVAFNESFEVIPLEIAEKIKSIDQDFFISISTPEEKAADPDDPYAEYEVPDDLVW